MAPMAKTVLKVSKAMLVPTVPTEQMVLMALMAKTVLKANKATLA